MFIGKLEVFTLLCGVKKKYLSLRNVSINTKSFYIQGMNCKHSVVFGNYQNIRKHASALRPYVIGLGQELEIFSKSRLQNQKEKEETIILVALYAES